MDTKHDQQLTIDLILNYIQNNKLEFVPTQYNLSLPILNRIYKKMKGGIRFAGISVKNGKICDGHHRYIAALLANVKLDTTPGELAASTVSVDWESVSFQTCDFDSPDRVEQLNRLDAHYNNLSVEQVVALLR